MNRPLPKRKLPKIPGRNPPNDPTNPQNINNIIQNPRPNIPISTVNQNQNQGPSVNDYISNVGNSANNQFQEPSQSRFQDTEFIKLQRRLRYRHDADGAININLQRDDLMNDKYNLYDNKDINYDMPKIKENIDLDNTEYYIESIHHDKYFKVIQSKKEEKKDEEEKKVKDGKVKGKKVKKKRALNAFEIAQATENKIFSKFDAELSDVISKTLSKVSLIFLFIQGLLAGMGLLHLVFITIAFTHTNIYNNHIQIYSYMVIILTQLFHALIFSSIVGNGIKFVSAYQKYSLINIQLDSNLQQFTRLRKNMIFSGILLICFIIVFAIEIYLVTYVQTINKFKCGGNIPFGDIDEYEKKFAYIHIIVDILAIILFVLNIFDANIQDNETENLRPTINVNYYLGSADNAEEADLLSNK